MTIKNESGVLKFARGALVDGCFEVLPYQMEMADIKHVIKTCTEYVHEHGGDIGVHRDPQKMSSDDIQQRIVNDLTELKLRHDLFKVQPKLVPFMPEQKPPTVVRVDLTDAEMALAESGRKIGAIKALRERTGLGLKDAKDQIDAYCKVWETAGKPVGGVVKAY